MGISNRIKPSQIKEMTTQEIKEVMETGAPNWMTLQLMGVELANRCIKLEEQIIDLPTAA